MAEAKRENFDHSGAELVWDGETPNEEIVAIVRGGIRHELYDLPSPGELGFHVVFLSKDPNGPTVTLWGMDGDKFGAEYAAKTTWVPLSDAGLE